MNKKNFIFKLKVIFVSIFLVYEIFFINAVLNLNLPLVISSNFIETWVFIIIYQIISFLSFLSILYRRFIKISSVILLLFFINLFLDFSDDLKTLNPNFNKKIEIIGEVMPGFEGVNHISTDNLGFRTTKKIDYSAKDSTRIFTIGGSTTEEIYHDDQETWSALLEKNLNNLNKKKYEVVNTGVSGLRTNNFRASLNYIKKYNPNYVLFFLGVNDWNRHIVNEVKNKQIGNNKYFYRTDLTKSPLFITSKKILFLFKKNNIQITNEDIFFEDGSFYSSRNNSLNKQKKINVDIYDVSDEYRKNLNNIVDICKRNEFKCMFINQPVIYNKKLSKEMRERLWMTPPNQDYTISLDNLIEISNLYNNWLLEFGQKKFINTCDLAEHLNGNEKLFYDDVHFNEIGSVEAAKKIFDCLYEYENRL